MSKAISGELNCGREQGLYGRKGHQCVSTEVMGLIPCHGASLPRMDDHELVSFSFCLQACGDETK